MKRALYFVELKDKTVQCRLCPWNCVLKDGERGKCRARENQKGVLYSLVYGKPCAAHIDPIEKKPLYHFYPGSTALSLGTAGCNLRCKFCQNWSIAQAKPEDVPSIEMPPEKVVEEAEKNKCKSIAYTYTEPTIFYEYALDTAKLARKKGIKNVMVTNGFINIEPLKELYQYIDSANVDLKGISDKFYKDLCGVPIEPVLEAIKEIKRMKVWLELTLLIIPGFNDSENDVKKQCSWIKENLGLDVPLHISRFFPDYMLTEIEPTPVSTLERAYKIAKDLGLNYVYIGNTVSWQGNTYCARCGNLLIKREGYSISANKIKKGKCSCSQEIAGFFE